MMNEKLIECVNNKGFGMPTLKGRRLTVYDVVTKIYYEETVGDALLDYEISLSEAKAAIDYCKNLCCQKDKDRIHFCDGCILRTMEEKWNFNREDYIETNDQLTFSRNGQFIYLGKIEELEEDAFGKPGWVIATKVYEKLVSEGL